MPKLVHVVGAGLAGLAAAVQLQRRGAQVVLHEAAEQAGGRCRSYYDRTLGATIDSGNHLVLSGHHATLAYLRAIGAADELTGPDLPEYPFADLATRARWTVRLSAGRLPWWIFDSARRVPDTHPADYLQLVPLLLAKPGRTVAQTLRCDGPLWTHFLSPWLLAMLNTEPRVATAELAAALVKDTLAAGGHACRPLVAKNGAGSAFVDPALRLLQHGGAAIRLGTRVAALGFADSGRVSALEFAGDGVGRIGIGANDAVILAVSPEVAQSLVPDLRAPDRFTAIVHAHFAIEPPFGWAPLTGLLNGSSQWLFAADGRLSVTINGADALLATPRDALARTIWTEVAAATGLPLEPMPAWQLAAEPRATFAAEPDQEMRRPGTRTRWTNLLLAGDWTATGLPATIEGAIRSGQKAADTLLNEPMERR